VGGGGEVVAPELNSSIDRGSELWVGLRFNRTKLSGIAGFAASPIQVYTGELTVDTPYLAGDASKPSQAALRFAELHTEGRDDIVYIQSADQALVDLGADNDSLTVADFLSFAEVLGGTGVDSLLFEGQITNSRVDAGSDDDQVRLGLIPLASDFDGGAAGVSGDVLVLPGLPTDYGFTYLPGASPRQATLFDSSLNSYTNFDSYRFLGAPGGPFSVQDVLASFAQEIGAGGSSPLSPSVEIRGVLDVPSGNAANYALYLLNSFANGASIDIELNAIGATARLGVDFSPILASSLRAFDGLRLSPIATDPGTNALSFSVENTSGLELPAGYQLFDFSVETRRVSQQQQPSKSFYVQLGTPNNVPPVSSFFTTISDGNGPAPRVDIEAAPLVVSGEVNTYGLYLADAWLQGGVIQLTLNALGGSALAGVDFEPLSPADLFASPGSSISEPVTNPATGAVSFLLENSSGFDLQAGEQILTFALQTLRSSPAAAQKTVNIELGAAGNALNPTVFTTTIVTPAPLPDPRIDLEGQAVVESGNVSTYALYLADTFAADGSVDIALNAIGGTAVLGVDFEALLGSDLTASPGLSLSTVERNPATGELSLSIGNASGGDLQAGAQLLTFTLQTLRSSFEESQKTVNLQLSAASNAINPTVFTTSIITPPPLIDVGGNDGGLVLPDLPARQEIPAPPPELADDADQDLSLPDGGKLITEGPVRNGVQILVGTALQDVIVGGLGPDFLDGGASSDTYTGGPEQDVFRRLYADPDPDVITDFAAGGDRVQIGAVPLLSSLGRRLNGRTQWKKALAQTSGLKAGKSSRAFFVHQRSSGRIYFNANRTDRGWGREGGLVVTIPAGEPFSWKDLQFDYGTASSADSLASLL
jgi:hypothetical protein